MAYDRSLTVKQGKKGFTSLGIILSNTFDTGLKIFLNNPIVSLYNIR